MVRNFIDYVYFMGSQTIFLIVFTCILLFFDNFNKFYVILFIIYGLFIIIPIVHVNYMLKNTNKTSFFVIDKEQKEFSSKKYLWYILLWAIPFIIEYFTEINNFLEIYLQTYFLPYIVIIILTGYFLFDNNHYEYWIFENIIFVNFLKYKIIEIKNKEGNTLQIFTKKSIKKSENIHIKHITGGLYYY